MINSDLVIIGGGPSGLTAAKVALESGLSVTLIDRNHILGGQLRKQTHKFFGSKAQYAKTRGLDIATILIDEIKQYDDQLNLLLEATVVGLYQDKVITVYQNNKYFKIKAQSIIVATGASEKVLAFENNDLPGIYGAGAVQTLMNLYGVRPGHSVVMVGSGNIGLIVSYQLIQAGVHVKALVEASDHIGGYLVHASKLRRLGVPIYTKTTINRAFGKETLEKVETIKLDDSWNKIPNTEEIIECDTLCISVGLSPLHKLLSMIGVELAYIKELGGKIPIVNQDYQTSIKGIYACGDVTGIEEASSAMVEGYITGLIAAKQLGYVHPKFNELLKQYREQLHNLRQGPTGKKIRIGLQKVGESHD